MQDIHLILLMFKEVGWLLKNVKVAAEIKAIKADMQKGIFIDAMDELNKWIKFAFADVTDYLTFG